MIKRVLWFAVVTLFFVFQINVNAAAALELDEASRTVKLNDSGETVVVDLADIKSGQKIFTNSCASCHNHGRTKTNPNVTLGIGDLEGAFPARDNIAGMVDYLINPTSYDGEFDLSQIHPNITRADIHPSMRNYNTDDLEAVASYVLVQPNISGSKWGGGKTVD